MNRLRHQLAGRVPGPWILHWFRHSHATALLPAGVPVHVVSRRLGHADVQTRCTRMPTSPRTPN
ncbi:tyrosine-type recombinase/integrase [Streptomyces sp. NPDC048560]|uniref:tyrosine-type recombinase/integrase n=1 Tax=Streptomyces sp. NPDC048560 TaxID=3155488 RepID=UPI00341D6793